MKIKLFLGVYETVVKVSSYHYCCFCYSRLGIPLREASQGCLGSTVGRWLK